MSKLSELDRGIGKSEFYLQNLDFFEFPVLTAIEFDHWLKDLRYNAGDGVGASPDAAMRSALGEYCQSERSLRICQLADKWQFEIALKRLFGIHANAKPYEFDRFVQAITFYGYQQNQKKADWYFNGGGEVKLSELYARCDAVEPDSVKRIHLAMQSRGIDPIMFDFTPRAFAQTKVWKAFIPELSQPYPPQSPALGHPRYLKCPVDAGYRALRILGCGGWCWHGVGACPMIEVTTLQTLGGPDMSHATFSAPDMTTYCGLEELGLVAVGMRCQGGGFVLKCRAAHPARLCPGCGRPGYSLGSRTRRLAHEPRGHQPTTLVVYVGRYHCRACSRSWCDDISQAAPPRAKLSFGALRWGLVCLIADNMSINRIAAHLAVAWHTANEAILAYGEELLLADSTRFEGVRVIGVDEHVWRHRGGDRYATVIVDLTPVRDHTGPARLLDVVQGRSKYVLSSWLAVCPQEWKDNIEIVAMDGFSGYKSAAASQLPGAVTVMDPFHVVHIAIDALEQCRQRVQQETLGHRGRKGDPLYAARKTLLTGTDILTDTSQARLDAVFACPDHADVHATWRIYQDLLAAYRDRDPRRGKNTLRHLITTLTRPGLPHTCIELARMGRTLTRRAGDILAYFDHPHTSNGPTEAINGRLEHLRGIAQGFINHRNYRLRCLLHSGGFQHLLHP